MLIFFNFSSAVKLSYCCSCSVFKISCLMLVVLGWITEKPWQNSSSLRNTITLFTAGVTELMNLVLIVDSYGLAKSFQTTSYYVQYLRRYHCLIKTIDYVIHKYVNAYNGFFHVDFVIRCWIKCALVLPRVFSMRPTRKWQKS